MQTNSKMDRLRSRLYIYRQGLDKARLAKNQQQITQWERSIESLEQEIEELGYIN